MHDGATIVSGTRTLLNFNIEIMYFHTYRPTCKIAISIAAIGRHKMTYQRERLNCVGPKALLQIYVYPIPVA